MNAIILSVGDELVLGQTVDTNSAWISQQLAAVGCDVLAHGTVPDQQEAIEEAIRFAAGKADFLLISGGIGPTADDLTRQALAAVMGVDLELNEAWLARLQSFFQKLGRTMPETNRIQAMIPRGATTIENTAGTAAGIHLKSEISNFRSQVFVMPGVPKEMKIMFERDVLPHIREKGGGAVILSRTLHTFGLGESSVAEKLGDLMKRDRNPSVGTTVANGIVSLRINARFPSAERAQTELDQTVAACRDTLGSLIFGADEQTLSSVIAWMLTTKQQTITTAESCTGGLLAKMLTDIPGSSDYFKQGWVTYSNEAKRERLGVSENILNVHGAVSEPVVEAMARAARRLAKSDFALAISGIAGPTGGTPTKPVGTVCIALAAPLPEAKPAASAAAAFAESSVTARTFAFTGDREMIRDRSAKMALTMLRFHLLGQPMPF
jgi:nicotinamide-nucleotide amidase